MSRTKPINEELWACLQRPVTPLVLVLLNTALLCAFLVPVLYLNINAAGGGGGAAYRRSTVVASIRSVGVANATAGGSNASIVAAVPAPILAAVPAPVVAAVLTPPAASTGAGVGAVGAAVGAGAAGSDLLSSAAAHSFDTSRSLWAKTMLKSAILAEQMLNRTTPRTDRATRLFIPLLTSRPVNVCCMIKNWFDMVGKHGNPADFFVFSVNNQAERVVQKQCGGRQDLPNIGVYFMALDEYWYDDPTGSASNQALWSYPTWIDYRRMGKWRLLFQHNLADMLKYRYLFQLDDDSEFTQPMNTSLIQWMQTSDIQMAGNSVYPDVIGVTWGLPELTRTFLIAERMTPPGTLLTEHCDPPGLQGLFTKQDLDGNKEFVGPTNGPQGWDRKIINGNCVLMDNHVLFKPEVQRFLELVIASQYYWRFRWNEQSVIGMVWQLFVPAGKYKDVPRPPGGYAHGRRDWTQC